MRQRLRQLDTSEVHHDHAPVLVLASASPRRRELLAWLGVEHVAEAADVDERPQPDENASRLVGRLAAVKAAAVAARRPHDWVLGADTIVELDGELLGKPVDRRDGAAMLARLSGREHRVATGFALLAPGGVVRTSEVVQSRVRFRRIEVRALAAYLETGEPDDKAGSYAIQGLGAALIDSVDGSFTNVMGLPLVEVERALADAGLLVR
jgi:septum formation protein